MSWSRKTHLEQLIVARLGLELAAVLDGLLERGGHD